MSKKKAKRREVVVEFSVDRHQTVPPLSRPKDVESRLKQLVDESSMWVRRCGGVWFDGSDLVIACSLGVKDKEALPALFEKAHYALREVAAYAKVAEEELEKAMATFEQKCRSYDSPTAPTKSSGQSGKKVAAVKKVKRPKKATPSQDEQEHERYFGEP